jgi:pimeloyl-ACP methyl ester carboxylesterase
LPKTGRLTRTKQVSGLEPSQESVEIREQLNGFTVLDWTRVQKIQSQLVAEEEEPILPFGLSDWFCHGRTLPKNYNTDNESIYRLAHPMLWMRGLVLQLPIYDASKTHRRLIMTTYQQVVVDGSKIFYREDGPKDRPTILLLHGFPTSSHMFRNLIPALADRYHLVAPDLPGFGFSDAPDRKGFRYSFENLAKVTERFTQTMGIDRYAIYVFDYGAPVGLRLALAHPERITAIISQNGNAYEEGLSEGWNPIQKYWKEPTPENRAALRAFLKPEATKWQYVHGVQDATLVAPEAYELDSALLARPGNDEIQLDLFLDYASNVALYPQFQEYFRTKKVPLLAVWGKNDPFFLPPGAEAFKRDNPNAEVQFYNTGHFALETHTQEIANAIRDFLGRKLDGVDGRKK